MQVLQKKPHKNQKTETTSHAKLFHVFTTTGDISKGDDKPQAGGKDICISITEMHKKWLWPDFVELIWREVLLLFFFEIYNHGISKIMRYV